MQGDHRNDSFNPELKVGMLAMVINVRMPEHTRHIGKTVMIEDLADVGEIKDSWFTDEYQGRKLGASLALISGLGKTQGVNGNMSTIQQKHLMPLPPLDDDVIIEATQKPKETVKC